MIKLRTQQIIIEMPRTDSEPWIHITIQRIELGSDGSSEVNVTDRWDQIHKRLSLVALQTEKYFEAVPWEVGFISVFGVADAIKNIATTWIIEKHGGTLNDNGDVII